MFIYFSPYGQILFKLGLIKFCAIKPKLAFSHKSKEGAHGCQIFPHIFVEKRLLGALISNEIGENIMTDIHHRAVREWCDTNLTVSNDDIFLSIDGSTYQVPYPVSGNKDKAINFIIYHIREFEPLFRSKLIKSVRDRFIDSFVDRVIYNHKPVIGHTGRYIMNIGTYHVPYRSGGINYDDYNGFIQINQMIGTYQLFLIDNHNWSIDELFDRKTDMTITNVMSIQYILGLNNYQKDYIKKCYLLSDTIDAAIKKCGEMLPITFKNKMYYDVLTFINKEKDNWELELKNPEPINIKKVIPIPPIFLSSDIAIDRCKELIETVEMLKKDQEATLLELRKERQATQLLLEQVLTQHEYIATISAFLQKQVEKPIPSLGLKYLQKLFKEDEDFGDRDFVHFLEPKLHHLVKKEIDRKLDRLSNKMSEMDKKLTDKISDIEAKAIKVPIVSPIVAPASVIPAEKPIVAQKTEKPAQEDPFVEDTLTPRELLIARCSVISHDNKSLKVGEMTKYSLIKTMRNNHDFMRSYANFIRGGTSKPDYVKTCELLMKLGFKDNLSKVKLVITVDEKKIDFDLWG